MKNLWKHAFIATVLSLGISSVTHAASLYWVGTAGADFSNGSNWSLSSGGAGGAGVPGAGDIAYFDTGNDTNCDISSPSAINVLGLFLDTGYTQTVSNSANVDITASSIKIRGGTLDTGSASTVSSANDISISNDGSLLASNTSLIDINGTTVALSMDPLGTGTISMPSTLNVAGSFTIPTSNITFSHNNGLIIFDGLGDNRSINNQSGENYNNVTINKDNSSLTMNIQSGFDLDGDFTMSTGSLNATNTPMTIAGDWTIDNVNSTFTTDKNVTFTGTNQSIFGSTNFHSFTKSVSSADTLTFEAGETQTFTSNLNLNGTSGNYLSLRSSVDNSQAQIDPQSTRNIDFVDVKDNFNINATDIDLSAASAINSGNNTGWIFPAAAAIPEFNTYVLVLTMLFGLGLIQQKYGILKR